MAERHINNRQVTREVQQMHARERSVREALDSIDHYDHTFSPRPNRRAVAGGAITAAVIGAAVLFAGPGSSSVTTAALNPLGFVSELLSEKWSTKQATHAPEDCGPIAENQGIVDSAAGASPEGEVAGASNVIQPVVPAGGPIVSIPPFDGPGGGNPGGGNPGGGNPGGGNPGGGNPGGGNPGGGNPGGGNPGGENPNETNLIEVDVDLGGHEIVDLGLLPGDLVDVNVDLLEDGQILDTEIDVGKGSHDILEVDVEADKGHGEILDVEVDLGNGHGEFLDIDLEITTGGSHGGGSHGGGSHGGGSHGSDLIGGLLGQ